MRLTLGDEQRVGRVDDDDDNVVSAPSPFGGMGASFFEELWRDTAGSRLDDEANAEFEPTRAHWQRGERCVHAGCGRTLQMASVLRVPGTHVVSNCWRCGRVYCPEHCCYRIRLDMAAKHDPINGRLNRRWRVLIVMSCLLRVANIR